MIDVMWQPPAHQFIIAAPEHPSGHGCPGCTETFPPQRVARRLTLRGARRRAEHLNAWSLRPGWFYAFKQGRLDESPPTAHIGPSSDTPENPPQGQ